MTRAVREAGESLPESRRTEEIRAALIEAVEARKETARPQIQISRGRPRMRFSWNMPLRVATSLALAVALVITLGFSSLRAMPGSALYPVKRVVERARVAFSGDGGRADQYLSQAASRLAELDFSKQKGMDEWYYRLASEAERDVEVARRAAAALEPGEAVEVERRSVEIAKEYEETVAPVLEELPEEEKAEVEDWIEEERENHPGTEPSEDEAPEVEESDQLKNVEGERHRTESRGNGGAPDRGAEDPGESEN